MPDPTQLCMEKYLQIKEEIKNLNTHYRIGSAAHS